MKGFPQNVLDTSRNLPSRPIADNRFACVELVHRGGKSKGASLSTNTNRIGLTQAYAAHRNPTRPKRITPEMAARVFRVPVAVINAVWPRVPFCYPIYQYAQSGSGNGNGRDPAQVEIRINPDDIMTLEEFMQFYKVTRAWLKEKLRRRCKDRIPCRNLGKALRFYKPETDAWFLAHSNGATKEVRDATRRNKAQG